MTKLNEFQLITDFAVVRTRSRAVGTITTSARSLAPGANSIDKSVQLSSVGDILLRYVLIDNATGISYMMSSNYIWIDRAAGYRIQISLMKESNNLVAVVEMANMIGSTISVPSESFTLIISVNGSTFAP